MDKLTQKRLQREAKRLIKAGMMPLLEEVRAAVLEARRKYANQIRRARREPVGRRSSTLESADTLIAQALQYLAGK